MIVWKIFPNPDEYHALARLGHPADSIAEWELFALPGPLKDRWIPPQVEFYLTQKHGDYPSYHGGHPPVFSERALNALHDYLLDCEILALDIKGDSEMDYKLVVPPIIDCLDMENSIVRQFKSSDRVMLVEKYVFKDNCHEQHIFRIPEEPLSAVFISDVFKEAVEQNGLVGFIFKRASS
jgi:hypothetical protein